MSEKTEKQQYFEGPWQRVSGPTPLTAQELNGWRDDLNRMYAPEDWAAVPRADEPGQFDIVVSPDDQSVYAGMARVADQEGVAGHPSSDPRVQENLGRILLEETGAASGLIKK